MIRLDLGCNLSGTYHHSLVNISGKLFGFSIGGPADELRPFTKSSGTDMAKTAISAALLGGKY